MRLAPRIEVDERTAVPDHDPVRERTQSRNNCWQNVPGLEDIENGDILEKNKAEVRNAGREGYHLQVWKMCAQDDRFCPKEASR